MNGSDLCRPLPWDSDFFGFPIARIEGTRLSPGSVDEIKSWARTSGVRCLYYLADAGDGDSVRAAEAAGFQLVDLRVTLQLELDSIDKPRRSSDSAAVQMAAPDDVPALREIARTSHRDSRFYFDPLFSRERCDELYATWIANSCSGFADAVLVCRVGRRPAGYITCHKHEDGAGQIGLVAVAEEARGRGLGAELVQASLGWFQGRGLTRARVVTQGRNGAALRLYERVGFLTRSIELSYHYWPDLTSDVQDGPHFAPAEGN